LMGLQGVVESRLKRDRLILQVDVLGQAMSLEIDGAILAVLDEPAPTSRDEKALAGR
jgi:hypothetical protein